MYRPSTLHAFLEEVGIKTPKKSLSQTFLVDGNIIKKIITVAQVERGERVLEIGPGPGAWTEALLERGCRVIAVEKDRALAAALKRFEGVEVHNADILTFPLDQIKGEGKIKVLSNLPYHLTSPILGLLLPRSDLFTTLTFMVQREVAERMVAKPNSSSYSSLTLFTQFYAQAKIEFTIKRTSLYPQPKVDSALITLKLKEPPLTTPALLFQLIRTAFNHRRKRLTTSLKELYEKESIEQALTALALPLTSRPEELSLEQFQQLRERMKDKG